MLRIFIRITSLRRFWWTLHCMILWRIEEISPLIIKIRYPSHLCLCGSNSITVIWVHNQRQGTGKLTERTLLHTRPRFPWTWPGLGNVVLHGGCKTTLMHDVSMTILTSFLTPFSHQFPPIVSTSAYKRGAIPNFSWSKKCSYFSVKLIINTYSSLNAMSKEEYARKRIHNGCSVNLKICTRVTVRHHSASLVMPNSYPHDRSFNQPLTTIPDKVFCDFHLFWIFPSYLRGC